MEPTTVAILAATAANAVVLLGGLALWLGYRARRVPRPEQPERLSASLEARLAELARAVDVIAVEVERIGEAQRYLMLQRQGSAQLERAPEQAPGQGRVVTPH